jgi:hypothetical protein
MRRSSTRQRAHPGASMNSARVALPVGKTAAPRGRVPPERGGRRADARLVEASVTARLLGMRILTLDATVLLAPADLRAATPLVRDRAAHAPARPSGDSPVRPGSAGHRLADAVRTLDEGARLLAEVQHDRA